MSCHLCLDIFLSLPYPPKKSSKHPANINNKFIISQVRILCVRCRQMKRVVLVPVFWVYTALFMAVLWPLGRRCSAHVDTRLKTRAMLGSRLSRNPGDKMRKSCLAYLTPPTSPSSTVSPASNQNAPPPLLPGCHCLGLPPAVREGAQPRQQDSLAGPRQGSQPMSHKGIA